MTKAVSEQSLKIKCYSRNETYPEMMVLVHFGPNLPQGNPKFFKKINFCPYDITQVPGSTSITEL